MASTNELGINKLKNAKKNRVFVDFIKICCEFYTDFLYQGKFIKYTSIITVVILTNKGI